VQVLALVEHVHLPAPDDRHGARLHRERLAVDQVTAAPGADPDQLVVVVPVGLAPVLRAHVHAVQPDDLGGLGLIGQPVDCELAGRGLHPSYGVSRRVRAPLRS
jgi:hypothetical protein